MRHPKHPIILWTTVVFAVMLGGAVLFIATLDWNKAKPYVVSAVSKATGREFAINGDLDVKLGWRPHIRASDIRLANAPWSKHPQMAELGSLDLQLDLRQLFKWRVVFPSITISKLKLYLEKNREGAANWDLRTGSAADAAVPQKRTQVPLVQKLVVEDSSIQFQNQQTNAHLDLNLNKAEAEGFLDQPVKLTAEGTYQKQPMKISLDGGSYENLTNARQPYPLQISLGAGKLKAHVAGNLMEPLALKGENVTLDIQGDDLANLYPLLRLVFPSTPPYRLKGRLRHEGDIWSFSNFSGRVGGSDLSGEIRVDTGRTPNFMKADLVSNTLDFKDLAGFIGGNPKNPSSVSKNSPSKEMKGSTEQEKTSQEQEKSSNPPESDRIFPDKHYDLQSLRAMNADVRLRAKKILAPDLPIDDLDGKLTLNNGVLKFTPANFGVANGRVEIYSTFDASKDVPRVEIDTRARHLDLKRFLGNSSFAEKTLGPVGGRIALSGRGDSFRELMATASGKTFIVVGHGEISNLLVRLAGLNVARALGVVVRGDKPIPVRCGLVDLEGQEGMMDVKTLVFDTGNTVIYGEGSINLRNEEVNIEILPVPKDFSPFSLRSYLRVTGTLKKPSVFPDPIKIGTKSIIQKALNALVMLVLSPFQPRDLGQGKDVDCAALFQRVKDELPKGAVPDVDQTTAQNNTPSTANGENAQNGKESKQLSSR
ncbi:MAG TPA: AsmA family protein [Candidatus Binatia bacterium]